MVVNYNEPSKDLTDRVVLRFTGYSKAAVWEDGVQKVYSLDNGRLALTLGGGDGYFVVPIA